MIPTIQFDPASLAIWTTTGTLDTEHASVLATALRTACHGLDPSRALNSLDDSFRTRALWLASSVWHEKRHFLDTCLTNYGARRFRDFFNLAGNFLPLIAEAKKRREAAWFPIEVYGCRVQRRLHGIPDPAPNILESARLARLLKKFVKGLDAAVEFEGQSVHLGGEAQMEGLAQVSQLHSIEYTFGADDVWAVTLMHVHRLPRHGPYRAIEAVGAMLGCFREGGDTIVVNPALAAALFVTALCGRFYGAGSEPPAHVIAPSPRLARMIEALGPRPGRFDMSDEEALSLVDTIARRLWGRTALEEVAADIDAMEERVNVASVPWIAEGGLLEIFTDFIALRRQVLARAREQGPTSLLPRAFPIVWRDRLRPWHVVATPGGDFAKDGDPVVFGMRLNVPAGLEHLVPERVTWGRLDEGPPKDPDAIRVRDRGAWLQMLERHEPRALLMLNGRRHRRMIPQEIERTITETEELGVSVRVHPRFDGPPERSIDCQVADAVDLAAFTGRRTFVCDITGDEIAPADAAVLTPWEFRRSSLLTQYKSTGFIAEIKLVTDWSDWIVRRDLLTI